MYTSPEFIIDLVEYKGSHNILKVLSSAIALRILNYWSSFPPRSNDTLNLEASRNEECFKVELNKHQSNQLELDECRGFTTSSCTSRNYHIMILTKGVELENIAFLHALCITRARQVFFFVSKRLLQALDWPFVCYSRFVSCCRITVYVHTFIPFTIFKIRRCT